MVFYQFLQARNEEFQSIKKWNSVVGIVVAGANGTVAAGWGTVNFAMAYRKFRNPSEIFAMPYFCYDSEKSLS